MTGKQLEKLVEEHVFGFVWDEKRCRICGWPLYEKVEQGCVSENCSLRPPPAHRADEPRPFTTDDGEAFRLLLKMQELWTDVTIESAGAAWYVNTPMESDSGVDLRTVLCKVALKSTGRVTVT